MGDAPTSVADIDPLVIAGLCANAGTVDRRKIQAAAEVYFVMTIPQ
jgi:hypothetical protein